MLRLAQLLTIVIPCKNEEGYIGKLLDDLEVQRESMGLKVIIADGGSTDRTLGAIKSRQLTCKNILISIAKGGSVSRGRNAGLEGASTPYVAFIDADVRFFSRNTLLEAVTLLEEGYWMVGAPIKSYAKDIRSKIAFKIFNSVQRNLIKKETFCVGQFCVARVEKVKALGGFDETVTHSEDYLLSKKIPVDKFALIRSYTGQDDRRFKKMGYLGFGVFMIRNFVFRSNIKTFKRKINYW
jgi:glycosyltransferase involved in cell wall biosynthesis